LNSKGFHRLYLETPEFKPQHKTFISSTEKHFITWSGIVERRLNLHPKKDAVPPRDAENWKRGRGSHDSDWLG